MVSISSNDKVTNSMKSFNWNKWSNISKIIIWKYAMIRKLYNGWKTYNIIIIKLLKGEIATCFMYLSIQLAIWIW